jgi:hypothetical protein
MRPRQLTILLAILLVASTGCDDAPDQPLPTGPGTNIATNTQARFGELNVGVGNIWESEYTTADGATRRGLTAGLWLHFDGGGQNSAMRVHPGQRITGHGYEIDVLAVEEDAVRIMVSPPRIDSVGVDVSTPRDPEPAVQGLRFSNTAPGEWEVLTGEVRRTIGGATQRTPISYHFEAADNSQARDEGSIAIEWSNDDEVTGRERGRFLVPPGRDLSLEEYLHALSGPFGDGRIVDVSTETRRVGDQSFSCWRVERRSETEHGSHATWHWLSPEAPAARIVAYRSHWEPAPEWADRAPSTELEVQLKSHGNGQGELWRR